MHQQLPCNNVVADAFPLRVAPATTVVELAGALDCPTLLLSNSPERHWRKRPGTMTDVWHGSVTHVEGRKPGDKNSLIVALHDALRSSPLLHKVQ